MLAPSLLALSARFLAGFGGLVETSGSWLSAAGGYSSSGNTRAPDHAESRGLTASSCPPGRSVPGPKPSRTGLAGCADDAKRRCSLEAASGQPVEPPPGPARRLGSVRRQAVSLERPAHPPTCPGLRIGKRIRLAAVAVLGLAATDIRRARPSPVGRQLRFELRPGSRFRHLYARRSRANFQNGFGVRKDSRCTASISGSRVAQRSRGTHKADFRCICVGRMPTATPLYVPQTSPPMHPV